MNIQQSMNNSVGLGARYPNPQQPLNNIPNPNAQSMRALDLSSIQDFPGMEAYYFERNHANDMISADAYRTLFLGDLSYFCTEEDLCALFSAYGRITTVRVRRGATGESLMHGFIALDTHEAAKQAIVDLDGAIFMGRNMRYF